MTSGRIRSFCAAVSFSVVGKLQYMGKWDHCNRWYMDEAQNAYLIDEVIGTIRIIVPRNTERKVTTHDQD